MNPENSIEVKTPLGFSSKGKIAWLVIAFATLIAVLMIPIPALTVPGHRMLAIAAFAVIVWVSECVTYSLSAFMIMVLMVFLLGFAPDMDNPDQILGLGNAVELAASGWVKDMIWFQIGGYIIAAAIQLTGLDQRICLKIVSLFKTAKGTLVGIIVSMCVLGFIMPPVVARCAAMVPIIVGMVAVFGQRKDSQLAAYFGIAMAVMGNTSAFGLMTGGSMNPLVAGFVAEATGQPVSWMQWFVWFMPYTIVMSVILYFLLNFMFKPEVNEVEGGQEAVKKMYEELGPWTPAQKRLVVLAGITLFFWAGNGTLFNLNLTAVTLAAVVVFMMPGIGIVDFDTLAHKLPWGSIMLFAVGLALGTLLLKSGAATWIAESIFGAIGLGSMGVVLATLVFCVVGVILHFGFSSSTALCSTYIPVVIAYINNSGRTDLSLVGIPLIILIATGLTNLVVNTPNTMIAYQTGTFTSRQFTKIGLINTGLSLIMIVIFTATYWHWMGIV